MGNITRTYTPVTGDTILAAHLNTDLDTIYSEFNGSIENANIAAAAAIAISKTALGTFTSWAAYTPTVSGGTTAGAGTYVTQKGSWQQVGKMVNFTAVVNYSAHTGTGDLRLLLPATAGTFDAALRFIGSVRMANVNFAATVVGISCSIATGNDYLLIDYTFDDAVSTNAQIINESSQIYVSGFYLVD